MYGASFYEEDMEHIFHYGGLVATTSNQLVEGNYFYENGDYLHIHDGFYALRGVGPESFTSEAVLSVEEIKVEGNEKPGGLYGHALHFSSSSEVENAFSKNLTCTFYLVGSSPSSEFLEVWEGNVILFQDTSVSVSEDFSGNGTLELVSIPKLTVSWKKLPSEPRIRGRKFFNSFLFSESGDTEIVVYGGIPSNLTKTTGVIEDETLVFSDMWKYDVSKGSWSEISVNNGFEGRFLANAVDINVKNTQNTWLGRPEYKYYFVFQGGYTFQVIDVEDGIGNLEIEILDDTWMYQIEDDSWKERDIDLKSIADKVEGCDDENDEGVIVWNSMFATEERYVSLVGGMVCQDGLTYSTHVAYFSMLESSFRCDNTESLCGEEEIDRLQDESFFGDLPSLRLGGQTVSLDYESFFYYGGASFSVNNSYNVSLCLSEPQNVTCPFVSPFIEATILFSQNEFYTAEASVLEPIFVGFSSDGWKLNLDVYTSDPSIDATVLLPTLAVGSGFLVLAFFSGMCFFSGHYVHSVFYRMGINGSHPTYQGENGLPWIAIDSIPRKTISPENENDTCAICLGVFRETVSKLEEPLKALPCGHTFHVECVDPWLFLNKVCPMCKAEVNLRVTKKRARTSTHISSFHTERVRRARTMSKPNQMTLQ
eukprot:augustus_masked-scaffold_4-processed-gene-15.34-mRNA-1 protein AED:0.44 eAED:0.46 QI:0/-1/0/1/-1/1/1/0/650